jgi:uroporphyrinogen decarboxylase
MNSKERVKIGLTRRGLPDRVPLQFDLCQGLLEAFGARLGIPVHYTHAWYDDLTYRISGNAIRTALGSDCVLVGVEMAKGFHPQVDSEGCLTNEFGMRMRQGPIYMELLNHPLDFASEPGDIDNFPFPDPLSEGRFDDALDQIRIFRDEYFIIGDIEITIFALMRHLVGMEKLLVDMAENAAYLDRLIQKCTAFSISLGKKLVEMGVDGIWAGDDFGGQNGMLISPRMWRRYFKEPYRQLYAAFKETNPEVLIMQHSDGAVAPILPEWVEAGMQVFNPVQPGVPGHEPEILKNALGNQLSFWGGIDQQTLLPFGTPAEIEKEVKNKIEILGRNGGYMAAPAHIIQSDTPIENVEAFIHAVLNSSYTTSGR